MLQTRHVVSKINHIILLVCIYAKRLLEPGYKIHEPIMIAGLVSIKMIVYQHNCNVTQEKCYIILMITFIFVRFLKTNKEHWLWLSVAIAKHLYIRYLGFGIGLVLPPRRPRSIPLVGALGDGVWSWNVIISQYSRGLEQSVSTKLLLRVRLEV